MTLDSARQFVRSVCAGAAMQLHKLSDVIAFRWELSGWPRLSCAELARYRRGQTGKFRRRAKQAGGGAPPDSGTAQPTYICISIKIRLDSDICQIGSEVYLI